MKHFVQVEGMELHFFFHFQRKGQPFYFRTDGSRLKIGEKVEREGEI